MGGKAGGERLRKEGRGGKGGGDARRKEEGKEKRGVPDAAVTWTTS